MANSPRGEHYTIKMKVLRPVPTFEQVVRIPDPVINLPDRVIEVSRPDPNLWDEHEDAVRTRSVMVARLRVHDHETRDAAHATGVPIDVIRSVMSSPASMAHSDALMEDAMSDVDAPADGGGGCPQVVTAPETRGGTSTEFKQCC